MMMTSMKSDYATDNATTGNAEGHSESQDKQATSGNISVLEQQEKVAPIAQSDKDHTISKQHGENDTKEDDPKNDTGNTSQDNQVDDVNPNDSKNQSSTLSTAFTISFEDDAPVSTKKQFGIRDSIRKFAPPKPHTIEKARTSNKSNNQDNSYMSIESAPSGCPSKHPFRRDPNNSCRSSGRKSDSSRHSNISDSAAFLIDKMLNCKQGDSLSSSCLNSSERSQHDKRVRSKCGTSGKKLAHSSDDILDDEIDFCEERSDNGTYIVGADPESDAARRKIDELFGVVKAAEASLLASGNIKASGNNKTLASLPPTRPSRLPDKKLVPRERQEHINRLAIGRHSSRSSSSSRQELTSTSNRQRSATRQARNSSCDRTSKLPGRRATSQSSRQSSNHEASDGDTRSSRSSFHEHEIAGQELGQQSVNNPSMKFNRAFALRRARLGLGDPVPLPRMPTNLSSGVPANAQLESESPNMSPRKTLAQRYANHQAGSGGGGGATQQQASSLSRTDGGRFSLRMRNNPVPSRLMSGVLNDHHPSGRSSQQGTIIDNYLNKVSSSKESRFNRSAVGAPITARHQNSVHSASATIPYQSSDELELASPSGYRSLTSKSMAARRENLSELEADIDYNDPSEKFNFSLNLDQSQDYKLGKGNRACNSAVSRRGGGGSNASQLGALDCLVISAISSLSNKIRGSVCDLMVEHAKRLPSDNETRLIVEEILPQLTSANSARPKSPTSIEEIDQSLYFDLAQALKNLKKVEQMVDVMKQISNQIPDSPSSGSSIHNQGNTKSSPSHHSHHSHHHRHNANKRAIAGTATEGSESNPNSESTSLSPT